MAEYVIKQGWLATAQPGSSINNNGGIGIKYQVKYVENSGYKVHYKLYAWYGINTGSIYYIHSTTYDDSTSNRSYGWLTLKETVNNKTIIKIPLGNGSFASYGAPRQMQNNSPPNIWYPVKGGTNSLTGITAPYNTMLNKAIEGDSDVFTSSTINLSFSSDIASYLAYSQTYRKQLAIFSKTSGSISLPEWKYGTYTESDFPYLTEGYITTATYFNNFKTAVIAEVNRRNKYTFPSYNTTAATKGNSMTIAIANGAIDALQAINNSSPSMSDRVSGNSLGNWDNHIKKLTYFRNRPYYGWDSGCNSGCVGLCQGCTSGCYNECTGTCEETCTGGCTGSATGASGGTSCNSCGSTCTAGSWQSQGSGCSNCSGTCYDDCYAKCSAACGGGCGSACQGGCKNTCSTSCITTCDQLIGAS